MLYKIAVPVFLVSLPPCFSPFLDLRRQAIIVASPCSMELQGASQTEGSHQLIAGKKVMILVLQLQGT